MLAGDELALYRQIEGRLKAAGQWRYCRGRPAHPCFLGAKIAAQRLLQRLPPNAAVLVMRDQALFDARVAILASNRTLLVPDDVDPVIYRIPVSALKYSYSDATKATLHIDPLPYGSDVWRGRVNMIVVGCTAWSRDRRQLWSLDCDGTADTLEALGPCEREWNDNSWHIPGDVPVACLAADEQEVQGELPRWAAGHCADAVFTPTREIVLGIVD